MADRTVTNQQTITRTEYLTLVGLLALLPRHKEAIEDIERAAASIVGIEVDPSGYASQVSDMTWDRNPSADALLRQLDIKVVPDESNTERGSDA